MTPDETRPALDDRVAANLLDELRAQNALNRLGLEEDALVALATSLALSLDYAFELRWAPRWQAGPN
jgi:hypothetical protein